MGAQTVTSVRGLHYKTGEAIEITMAEGKISSIQSLGAATGTEHTLPWIGPGLVDLQINGYSGMDFNTLPIPAGTTHKVTQALWNEGVTSYFPTVITNSDKEIEELVGAIARECDEDPLTEACIAGIHLEGPFISMEDGARGAHSKAYVKAPDWNLFQRWQEAAGGRIRIVTISPEWPEAVDFIQRCVESGVIVSIGHTAATPEQIRAAVDAGASMSTHLGNGSHLMLPRHPNYIWEQLADERLWSCIIADGFHLPDAVLKVVRKVKGDRALLVSDAVMLSGMPAGEYNLHIGGQVVKTPEGRLHTAANPKILAGSAQMLAWGMSHLIDSGICDRAEAWDMSSIRPAALIKHEAEKGLVPGAPADLALLEIKTGAISIVGTVKDGVKVMEANS